MSQAVIVHYGSCATLGGLIGDFHAADAEVTVVSTGGCSCGASLADRYLLVAGVGYGTAANHGVASLPSTGDDRWLFIVNDDCRLTSEGIEEVASLGRTPTRPAAIAFPLRSGHDRRPFLSLRHSLLWPLLGNRRYLARRAADTYPQGHIVVLPESSFRAVGGFDPRYFLYQEESDLYSRLRAAGVPIEWGPEEPGLVDHYGQGSTGSGRALYEFELGRSSALYARAHHAGVRRAVLLGLTTVRLVLQMGRALVDRRGPTVVSYAAQVAGLASGTIAPHFEPLRHTRVRPARLQERLRLGRL